MEGAAPNLEKMYEKKISEKLSYSMQALLGLYKPRDRQLVGLLNKAVIPPALVQAKNWYQYRIQNARSERFKAVLLDVYKKMISPLVDMFTPYPVPIDTLLKDKATSQGELNVFGIPSMPKKKKSKVDEDDDVDVEPIDEDRMQAEKDLEIAKMEEVLREAARESFTGPDDDAESESPFLTFRNLESDD